jgi:PEGA domain
MRFVTRQLRYISLSFLTLALLLPLSAFGRDDRGEIRLHADNDVAKHAGVWVDGNYLGYVDELKGSKKVRVSPGEHDIRVRQAGYTDFQDKVTVRPRQKQTVRVSLVRDPRAELPTLTGEVKFWILPDRAAVFVDNEYAGYAQQFGGPGKGMLLGPGKHHIKVALPGYEPFDTEIEVRANQRYDIHTELLKGGNTQVSSNGGNEP